MHLYSADIASSFLDMLNSPSVPPVSPTSVSVQITAISYKPYNTLRDRILAQLYPSWHGKPSQTNVAEEGAVEEKSEGVR